MKRFWSSIARASSSISPLSCRNRYEWCTKGIAAGIDTENEVRRITPLRICFDPSHEALVLSQLPGSSSAKSDSSGYFHGILADHHRTIRSPCQHHEEHGNVSQWGGLLHDCQLETLRRSGSIATFLQGTSLDRSANFVVDAKDRKIHSFASTGMTIQSIPLPAAAYAAFLSADKGGGVSLLGDVFNASALRDGVSTEDAAVQWEHVERQGVRRCGVIDLEAAGAGENVAFFLGEDDLRELFAKVLVTGSVVMRKEVETKWPAVQELLERLGVKVDGLKTPWFLWSDDPDPVGGTSPVEMVLNACDEICWDV